MSRRGGGAAMGCAARQATGEVTSSSRMVRATTRSRALNVRAASVRIATP
jgi:hypothetical protein